MAKVTNIEIISAQVKVTTELDQQELHSLGIEASPSLRDEIKAIIASNGTGKLLDPPAANREAQAKAWDEALERRFNAEDAQILAQEQANEHQH